MKRRLENIHHNDSKNHKKRLRFAQALNLNET